MSTVRRNAVPQRRPDGRWRCENGAASRDSRWCKRAAKWVVLGCTTSSPGALTCDEHRDLHPWLKTKWEPLDNPTRTNAGANRGGDAAADGDARHRVVAKPADSNPDAADAVSAFFAEKEGR